MEITEDKERGQNVAKRRPTAGNMKTGWIQGCNSLEKSDKTQDIQETNFDVVMKRASEAFFVQIK